MPYQWDDMTKGAPVKAGAFSFVDGNDPALQLILWPHRSLPRKGFVAFIGITFALLMLPAFAVLGTMVLWGLLPFLLGALALLWALLERSYKDGQLTETLTLWSDHVELIRDNPRGPVQDWQVNPHWMRVKFRARGGPVENYLTLTGGEREVELGAFLSPDERKALHDELNAALARLP